ncbi:transporter substrate-binding domain-containing protein [Alysiella filiformis]|uniref:Polar amino acid transport system substrate-binding protein n=1 Tax=Alysiella filiformis DSM 16848 TaxID=1120981 RepID=A0A286E2C7_9NEIS|nr:transporter substrate-binding domain-containing protein [Alysiella filiformis]QMT30882.1 transporter substrate-binding domain-containing protein [Alysiella filiformis]UBQ56133.1 transporter substrate-binding domain-containing protein [Alysiella filiformis DSM 16848]SOD65050.1 polar amino acid transport system substrate-binding protein [Alysiella filiformis DSM 16848]
MKKHLTFLTAIAASLILVACGESNTTGTRKASEPTPTSEVTTTKPTTPVAPTVAAASNPDYPTYLVGSEINYEPFEFKQENGMPTGFEVELLQAIAEKAKFNVTFIHTPRKDLVDTLNNGKFVIWASAISITPERMEQMDFSQPFLDFSREIYILDKPENANLKTAQDFKGKKIAVNGSSKSNVTTAQELTGAPENVIAANSFYLSLAEMYKGSADGTLGDSRILQYYQLKQKDIKTRVVPIGDKKKDLAFAVRKGNTQVLKQINDGLAAVKADGTYDKLLEKWFGQVK